MTGAALQRHNAAPLPGFGVLRAFAGHREAGAWPPVSSCPITALVRFTTGKARRAVGQCGSRKPLRQIRVWDYDCGEGQVCGSPQACCGFARPVSAVFPDSPERRQAKQSARLAGRCPKGWIPGFREGKGRQERQEFPCLPVIPVL